MTCDVRRAGAVTDGSKHTNTHTYAQMSEKVEQLQERVNTAAEEKKAREEEVGGLRGEVQVLGRQLEEKMEECGRLQERYREACREHDVALQRAVREVATEALQQSQSLNPKQNTKLNPQPRPCKPRNTQHASPRAKPVSPDTPKLCPKPTNFDGAMPRRSILCASTPGAGGGGGEK